MKNKLPVKWICFVIMAILTILSPFYIQQRSTSLRQGGVEYQWPVALSRTASWIPSDYLDVKFLGSRTNWQGTGLPVVNQEAYIWVEPKANGILEVKGASNEKPATGEYILARLTKVEKTDVEFQILFNRVTLDLNKVDPQFYTTYKGTLLATLKIKDGYGVVTGVYSKGVSIETAVPESVEQQELDSRTPLSQIGEPRAVDTKETEEREQQ
ncbi:hypothetical protein [uncultured Veillonella sp.]|uniref:hypothetical protein n=1 Tax=uncultured Veillonella sp. TaxID=159268 RepID=UPI0025E02177|nr:hypothetical protein [uncultured Veillonella sp.]